MKNQIPTIKRIEKEFDLLEDEFLDAEDVKKFYRTKIEEMLEYLGLNEEPIGTEIRHKEGLRSWEYNKDLTLGWKKATQELNNKIRKLKGEK